MGHSSKVQIACTTCPARDSRFCSALEGGDIGRLDAVAHRISITRGEYLFEEEDASDYVYNISTGTGLLERLSSDGRRQVMAFIYAGDFVGLMPDPIYKVSAKALQPMTVCRWHIKDINNLIQDFPEIEHRLRRIGNRVLATTLDQVFALGCKNAQEKVAYFLFHLERRQDAIMPGKEHIQLPMVRGDIADYLGITVETVCRVFSKMRKDNLIALPHANEVVILNRPKLEEIAEMESSRQ